MRLEWQETQLNAQEKGQVALSMVCALTKDQRGRALGHLLCHIVDLNELGKIAECGGNDNTARLCHAEVAQQTKAAVSLLMELLDEA